MPDVYIACRRSSPLSPRGTIAPATVAELARKNGHPLRRAHRGPLRLRLAERLPRSLLVRAGALAAREDWERAAYESVIQAVPYGLRYRETFFTPPATWPPAGPGGSSRHHPRPRGGETETGVRCMAICDMDRAYGGAAGRELVERLVELAARGAPTA